VCASTFRPGQSDSDYYYCHSRPQLFSRDARGRVSVHFIKYYIPKYLLLPFIIILYIIYITVVRVLLFIYYHYFITIIFNTMSGLEPAESCRRVVFDRVLGKGTFSTVYRALVEPDNKHIALKIVHMQGIVNDLKTVQDCVNEISNLKVGTTIILCSPILFINM